MRLASSIVALLLVSAAFSQEPNRNHTSIKEAEPPKATYPVVGRGMNQSDAPTVLPKPLPVLHPSLAEIARAARAARANSQRAQLTVETDDLPNRPQDK